MRITTILLAMPLLLMAVPTLAADGPELYRQNCVKCHGDTGHADSWRGYLYFARNFTKSKWQAANTDEDIIEAINRGPRIMPSFRDKLTVEEKQAVLKVIRDFGKP